MKIGKLFYPKESVFIFLVAEAGIVLTIFRAFPSDCRSLMLFGITAGIVATPCVAFSLIIPPVMSFIHRLHTSNSHR